MRNCICNISMHVTAADLNRKSTEASKNFKMLEEETGFYHNLHSQLLMAQAQLKNKVNMLKQENRRIWGRCATLQQNLGELKMIYKNQPKDTSDPQTQQQQDPERMEELLQDSHKQKELGIQEKNLAEKQQYYFDVLRKSRFLTELSQLKKKVEMLSQENKEMQEDCALLQHHVEDLKPIDKKQQEEDSDLQTQHQKHMERMEEKLQYVLKKKNMAIKQRELAEKLKYHFEVLQMRFDKLKHEMELAIAQEESILQKDLLHQEPPAEPHPQKPQNPSGGFALT
ncbi:LOW QUALITY PROTEIN: disks large homolog 5-like [Mus caroli]|uniref:LOW QUALITY PROTEIN: disks large homolog 5-like n=1 Tax=Mus caroli TaxID=10089 RepID=A0A6P5R7D3_MUSCR|nr:LOW QUALITY PROTEIN: disks large homolog 5-like [Mus caroli]